MLQAYVMGNLKTTYIDITKIVVSSSQVTAIHDPSIHMEDPSLYPSSDMLFEVN